jgi:hypothetical protein
MRSLFYMADRNKLADYEKWEQNRLLPVPNEEDLYDDESLAAYVARGPRAGQKTAEERLMAREALASESECRASYELFKALCRDQFNIEREQYDQSCLRALFEGCPGLREVTVASQRYCMRELDGSPSRGPTSTTRTSSMKVVDESLRKKGGENAENLGPKNERCASRPSCLNTKS